jgi:hypothetical protein
MSTVLPDTGLEAGMPTTRLLCPTRPLPPLDIPASSWRSHNSASIMPPMQAA